MRISDWSSDVCSSDLSVTVGKNMQMERRRFVSGALGGGAAAAMAAWFPAWAQPVSPGITAPLPTVSGNDITLRIARQTMRSEEHTSELQSLMRISYAVFCLTTKTSPNQYTQTN